MLTKRRHKTCLKEVIINAPPLSFQNGLPCHVSDENIKASLLMYASYFVLFCKFFFDSYMSKRRDARAARLAASAPGEWTGKCQRRVI